MGTYESACTLHRNESFLRKLVSEKWVNGNSIISKVYMIFICTYVLFQLHVFITNDSLLTDPFLSQLQLVKLKIKYKGTSVVL